MTDEQKRIIYELKQLDIRLKTHKIIKEFEKCADGTDFWASLMITT